MRFLAVILLTTTAHAADGVYQLRTDLGNGLTGYGVCACVGATPERFTFLTCAHLVDGGKVSVVVSEREFSTVTATATVLATDEAADLALIAVARRVGGVSLPVWELAAPAAGAAQQWTRELIPVNSQIAPLDNGFVEPTLTTLIEAEEGDSGAPIVQNGKIVGIVFGRPGGKAQYRCGPQGCFWEPGLMIRSPIQPVQIPMATPQYSPQPYVRQRGTTYATPGDYASQWHGRVVISTNPQATTPIPPQSVASQPSPGCSCREQFAAIERRLCAVEAQPLQGAQGERGETGLQGPPPSDEQVAAAVAAYMRLHPVGNSETDLQQIRRDIDSLMNAKHRVVVVKDGKVVQAREYGITDDVIISPSMFTVEK